MCAFYNKKNEDKKDASTLYSFVLLSSVFVTWVIMFLIDGQFDWAVLPYAFLFSIGFMLAMVMMVEALKCGPIVLTSLIMQLSLIGATIWGFFFWNDEFSWTVGGGLVLVVLSLWLCLYTGQKEEQKINLKWLFFVLLMFLGNAYACKK